MPRNILNGVTWFCTAEAGGFLAFKSKELRQSSVDVQILNQVPVLRDVLCSKKYLGLNLSTCLKSFESEGRTCVSAFLHRALIVGAAITLFSDAVI